MASRIFLLLSVCFAAAPHLSTAQSWESGSPLSIERSIMTATDSSFILRCPTPGGYLYKLQSSDTPFWTNPVDMTNFSSFNLDTQVFLLNSVRQQYFRVVRQTAPDFVSITVRARGNLGTEAVDLSINRFEVASWPVTKEYQTFTYTTRESDVFPGGAIDSIRVSHNSGPWENAVIVDYMELNGVRYESEAPSTFSVGSWNEATRCLEGFKESEWLSCNNGYFEYALDGPAAIPLVVFDTDMGPDIDDALALAMLHSYQDAGRIEIAAVTVSRDSPMAARYIDVLNTEAGRPDIPIGLYRGGTVSANQANNNGFTALAPNYPHDVQNAPIADGYTLIREVLANAGDRPVLVIQTGFFGTLSALMDSGADEHSDLSGRALAAQTVDTFYLMGGRFGSTALEFNIVNDLSSAKNLFQKWDGKILLSDWGLGAKLIYPYGRGVRDVFDVDHPLRAAYEFRVLNWHRDIDPNPPPEFYNMASWDLTAVIQAIEPDANYFQTSPPGTVTLSAEGRTTFVEDPAGKHTLLLLPEDTPRTINRMIDLVR